MSYFKIVVNNVMYVADILDNSKLTLRQVFNELGDGNIRLVAYGDVLSSGKTGNFVSIVTGKKLAPKKDPETGLSCVSFNGYQNQKAVVWDIDDRRIWEAGKEKWISEAKNPGFRLGEQAPILSTIKVPKAKEGWTYTHIEKKCGNPLCKTVIPGIVARKLTQSIFTPEIQATKGEGKNARKWYCSCTTFLSSSIPKHPEKQKATINDLWPMNACKSIHVPVASSNVTITFNGSVSDVAKAVIEMAKLMGGK